MQSAASAVDEDWSAAPASVTVETVLSVLHWTDELFELRIKRPDAFRFRSGEFVMLGLMVDGKPLLRAYSIASPAWDEGLDFYSIKVADGPLTSRLQHIQPGDRVLLGKKPTGTLVLDALKPGRRLFLFSTGTGIAPFASVLREPETYDKFEHIVLTHTCRNTADLSYSRSLFEGLKEDPLIGEVACDRVTYYPSTTRERFERMGRITALIDDGTFFNEVELPGFNPSTDRVMICGSSAMIDDTRKRVEAAGLTEGSNAAPGDYVVEKAFVG